MTRYAVNHKGERRLISDIPWWRKDYHGWPIVFIVGRPVRNALSVLLINLVKKPLFWVRRHIND